MLITAPRYIQLNIDMSIHTRTCSHKYTHLHRYAYPRIDIYTPFSPANNNTHMYKYKGGYNVPYDNTSSILSRDDGHIPFFLDSSLHVFMHLLKRQNHYHHHVDCSDSFDSHLPSVSVNHCYR